MSKDVVLEIKVRRISSKGNDKEMFGIYSHILEEILEEGYDAESVIYNLLSEYNKNPRVSPILDDLYEELFGEDE